MEFIIDEICRLMRKSYQRKWITVLDGNISYLDGSIFLITKSGVRKNILGSSDILSLPVLGDDPNPLNLKVSGEFEMHRRIQQETPGAVIHVHPTSVVAAMEKGWKLPDISSRLQELSRYTKVGPNVPKLPVISEILAKSTYESFLDAQGKIFYDIVGQEGHGVCSRGRTLQEAFDHIERLDHACEIMLRSGVDPI